ncbi:MAG: hypothetical protein ACKO1M_03105 [Planctomycetota bacterium]
MMLGLYGLVSSGLPLPLASPAPGSAAAGRLAGKDRSRPFPCMDKACGCDSAERCFSNCCCHTPAETLRWAKARGIEPAVIAALERRVAAAAPAPAAGGCCAAKQAKPSCCAAEAAAPVAESDTADESICSEYRSLATEPGLPPESPADEQPATKVVILRAMLACNGIVAQWAAACVSLPPPETVTCEIPWPRVGEVLTCDEGASGTGGPPDLPPPRA